MARYVHCLSAESGNIKINLACLVKVLFFYCTRDHGGLHSFPTRRSSDLQANILAATADHPDLPGKAMNIGCGGRYSINELLRHLQEIMGTDVTPAYVAPRPGDVRDSQADITLARTLKIGRAHV